MPRARLIAFVLVGGLLAAGAALLTFAGAKAGSLDDAFILVVYVRHLLEHGAIFWNAGEGHVDGCTSLLDLLVKAVAVRLTGGDLVRTTFWVTLALHVVVGWIALGLALAWRRDRRDVLGPILAAVVVAATPALADGSSFLLETPLYVALGLCAIGHLLVVERWDRRAIAALVGTCVLLGLARPEGVALGLGVLLVFGREAPGGVARRTRVAAGAAYVVFIGAYLVWHRCYFGAWAPNTYYAKSSASRLHELADGLKYLGRYAGSATGKVALASLVAAPFLVWADGWSTPRHRRRFAMAVAAALGCVLVTIVAGGDPYPGGRFLALPLVVVTTAIFYGHAHARGRLADAFTVLVCLLGATHVHGALRSMPDRLTRMRTRWPVRAEQFECERELATRLTRAIPGGSVAQTDFQMLKYFADDLVIIDLHGLNDRQIAHHPVGEPVGWGKHRPASALRRRPDAWLWGLKVRQPEAMSSVSLRQLLEDPALEERFVGRYPEAERPGAALAAQMLAEYLPASVPLCGEFTNLLVRSALASRFAAAGFIVGTRDPVPARPRD